MLNLIFVPSILIWIWGYCDAPNLMFVVDSVKREKICMSTKKSDWNQKYCVLVGKETLIELKILPVEKTGQKRGKGAISRRAKTQRARELVKQYKISYFFGGGILDPFPPSRRLLGFEYLMKSAVTGWSCNRVGLTESFWQSCNSYMRNAGVGCHFQK